MINDEFIENLRKTEKENIENSKKSNEESICNAKNRFFHCKRKW